MLRLVFVWFFVTIVGSTVGVLLLKWILAGKTESGRSLDLSGHETFVHLCVLTCQSIIDRNFTELKGSCWYNMFLRLFGASIGKDVQWFGMFLTEPDCIQVDDGTLISHDVVFMGHNVEDGTFTFESIHVSKNCFLGERSMIAGMSVMEPGSELLPCAQGMKGMRLRSGKVYGGNPADVVS
tara:strand:+ start:119 stop:661 length:543 start_codon:yes stop_codon:yes gene_type:complete